MNHLTFAHPNAKNTGTAVKFELHPAEGGREGRIAMWIAPQKERQSATELSSFDWDKAALVMFSPLEIGGLLEVLRGYHEKLEDGRGYFHRYSNRAAIIHFEHQLEPIPSYVMTLTEKTGGVELREIAFMLSTCEGLVLSEVFTSALVRMAFG